MLKLLQKSHLPAFIGTPLISHICEEMGENILEIKIFQIKE